MASAVGGGGGHQHHYYQHVRHTSQHLIPLQDHETGEVFSPEQAAESGRALNCIGSFQRGELLGSGSFGKVYSALDLTTGAYVALKQVTVSDTASGRSQREVEALEHEVALLKTLSHPNIVQYYGTRRVRRKLYIILEYCSGGSVASALKQFGVFSEVSEWAAVRGGVGSANHSEQVGRACGSCVRACVCVCQHDERVGARVGLSGWARVGHRRFASSAANARELFRLSQHTHTIYTCTNTHAHARAHTQRPRTHAHAPPCVHPRSCRL
jgi:hypothetical protein